MIFTRIISGLGNQLFQWAVARSLAERHRTDVRLDVTFYDQQTYSYAEDFPRPFKLRHFRVKAKIASTEELKLAPDPARLSRKKRLFLRGLHVLRVRKLVRRIKEPSFDFHPHVLEAGDDVYLQGYWASEKYFRSTERIIREELKFADPKIEETAGRYLAQHRKPGVPVVGVQVRKGDIHYLHEVVKKPELAPTPLLRRDYFLRGMQHFGSRCTFLMFSDSEKDLQLCREEFRDCPHITYVSGNDDITDFAILQKCDHQIISNSTFGWWAGWLNENPGKTVVAPAGWFTPDSPHVKTLPDLVPASWKLL